MKNDNAKALEIPNDLIKAMHLGFTRLQHINREYYNQGVRQALEAKQGNMISKAIECLNAAIDDNHTATGRLQNIHTARNILKSIPHTPTPD